MLDPWSKYVCLLSAPPALIVTAYSDVLRLPTFPLLITYHPRAHRIHPNSRSPRRLALPLLSRPLPPLIRILRRELRTVARDLAKWERSGGSRGCGGQLLVSMEGQEETDGQRKGKYVSVLEVAPL